MLPTMPFAPIDDGLDTSFRSMISRLWRVILITLRHLAAV